MDINIQRSHDRLVITLLVENFLNRRFHGKCEHCNQGLTSREKDDYGDYCEECVPFREFHMPPSRLAQSRGKR